MASLSSRLYQEVTENKLLMSLFMCYFFLVLFIGILHPKLAELWGTKFSHYASFEPMTNLGGDYIANYVAANTLISGHDIYQDNSQYGDRFTDQYAFLGKTRFDYPPLTVYLVAPFALFSFYTSYKLWILFNLLVLLATIYLLAKFADYPISAFIFLAVVYFNSYLLYFYLERGQFDIIVFFFLVLSLYFYHLKKNNGLCALFLTIAIGLKVYPAIFVFYFLIRKKYRLVIYTLLFGIAIAFLTGINHWVAYLNVLSTIKNIFYLEWHNHSIAALIAPLVSFLGIKEFFNFFYYGFVLTALGGIFYTFNKGSENFIIEISSLSILMTLIPGMSWDYNLLVLGFVFLSVFAYLKDNIQYGTSFYKTTLIILVLIVIVSSDHFMVFFDLKSKIINTLFMRMKIISLLGILFFNIAYQLRMFKIELHQERS